MNLNMTKQGEVKSDMDQEETKSLLSLLPPEMVVMVASHLDVSSYLALASSSTALLDILVSQIQWEALLRRTRMHGKRLDKCEYPRVPLEVHAAMSDVRMAEKKDMEGEVRELAVFLKTLKDPGNKLLLTLLHTICERFPANISFYLVVSVSCPCNSIHSVTPFGFSLLEQAETLIGGALEEPQQKLIWYNWFAIQYLREVASRASRQKQKVKRLEIMQTNSNSDSSKEMKALWLTLLQKCQSWKIEQFFVHNVDNTEDNFDGVLEEMADESARGTIGTMLINDKIMSRTQRAHLKMLWKITEDEWQVVCLSCKQCFEVISGDWSWTKASAVIKKIKTKKHVHYKMCDVQ